MPSRRAGARRCRTHRATTSTWCAPAARPARPKGVLWRQADIFVAAMGGSEETTAESIELALLGEPEVWFAAPPFMHAAAQWTAYAGLHAGASVVMHDDSQRFDAAEILRVAEARAREPDLHRRRRLRPFRSWRSCARGSYDLSALRRIGTGGADDEHGEQGKRCSS